MLLGCMQDDQLLISSILDYAAENHPDREVVSKLSDGTVHRYGYSEVRSRAKRLAQALLRMGIHAPDRVATVASNSFRHLECFYGVSGIGAVVHTINPRLFGEQIKYIASHAEDRILIVDPGYVDLLETLVPELPAVEACIILCDESSMPATTLPNALCYETILAAESGQMEWPTFDERAASSLCYTSGTTGNPKGVLFSHRSTVLHAMNAAQTSVLGIGPAESILLIAPMYHANAWSIPYVAPLVGAKLILPGRDMGAANLHGLIASEQATLACAVPTVWNTLLQHVEENKLELAPLSRAVIAGVAVPPVMIDRLRERYDIAVLQFWGMTEMSPIATISTPVPILGRLAGAAQAEILSKQGRMPFGVRLKVVDDLGNRLPRDGRSTGHILGRGPWIANGYFKGAGGNVLDAEGWLPSGDVGFLDEYGYLKVTDRSKDVIKSGGEWISSVDLENAALTHEAVREAAVVGVRHPKWDERPLLLVTLKPGRSVSRDGLIAHLAGRFARWSLPDDVVFLDEMPYTATGKIKKAELRDRYRDYLARGS